MTMKVHEIPVSQFKESPSAELILSGKIALKEKKKNAEYFLLTVILLDALIFILSIVGFMALQIPLAKLTGVYFNPFFLFLGIASTLGILIASYTETYNLLEGVKLSLKIKNLFLSTIILFGAVNIVYYQFFYSIFDIHFLIPAFVSFFALSSLVHMAIRYLSRGNASFFSYAVVGGKPFHLNYLEKMFSATYGENTLCLGRFGEEGIPKVQNLGGFEQIKSFLETNGNFNRLLYFDSNLTLEQIKDINHLCRQKFIDFEVVPMEVEFFDKGTQIEQLDYLPILRRKKEPLCQLKNRLLKRAFDIIFSLLVILLIFPWLFPIIALLIKLESRGPVLFTQVRSGYWNKPFNCFKFRSMKLNNNSDEKQAVKNDSRITKIGAILRKTNLDEIPQFFNVLWGDMSIVGPRPHMLKHTEDYSKLIDTYMIRHEVKPGITGWAQVSGWRGPTEEVYKMEKRVEYDVHYIENWSFWFDCKCIFLTVVNVFKGEGNAF
jgi:putative colanic acid biosynthesis UDP-glucose lipid carrier transferase